VNFKDFIKKGLAFLVRNDNFYIKTTTTITITIIIFSSSSCSSFSSSS